MAFFLLSLAGFPPTAGFFGKFLVFAAAIQAHNVALALWGIGTSAVSVFYYLRVTLIMFQRPAEEEPAYDWPRTGWAGSTVLLTHRRGHPGARRLRGAGAHRGHDGPDGDPARDVAGGDGTAGPPGRPARRPSAAVTGRSREVTLLPRGPAWAAGRRILRAKSP